MANTARPDVEAGKPWREHRAVKAFYASMPPGDEELAKLLRPVMLDELRADAVVPRLRAAAMRVEDNPDQYPATCRANAAAVLRKVGRGSKTPRPVELEGGRKGNRFTLSAKDSAEKAKLEAAADAAGLSLSAWALTVLRREIERE